MILLETLRHYSYKSARLASILLLVGMALPSLAAAAGEFDVTGVAVDADGAGATQARARAMEQGQVAAFRQIVTKRAPVHSASILTGTTPKQIAAFIRGYEITSEKITDNHYHATVNYHFDPRGLGAWVPLDKAAPPAPAAPAATVLPGKTPASPPPAPVHTSKAVLVLPVYNENASTKFLWQDENKWRNIWFESALESGGGLVIVPLGDLDDRVDVDDSNVSVATPASLARMYGRYGVGEIYAVTGFYNLKADPKPTLEVEIRHLEAASAAPARMNFTIRSTETLDMLMIRASSDIAAMLYKQQTIDRNKIEYERVKEINARVNTADIREWEDLRKRLLTHNNIVSIQLTSISFFETKMVITFKGTPDMLGKTLVASGMRVQQDGDDLVLSIK
jgi:hypothetical protein